MTKPLFQRVILILSVCCLWTGTVVCQPFPDKPTARIGKGNFGEMAYSPDGTLFAIAGSLGIWLYDAKTLTEIGLLEGHTAEVRSVAFSPDGLQLASGANWPDNTIRLWDVGAKKQTAVLKGHTSLVGSLAFSPDGKTLASGSFDATIRLWDMEVMRQIDVLRGHREHVRSVDFSPDGKTLASGGGRREDYTVRLWDVAARKQIAVLAETHKHGRRSCVFPGWQNAGFRRRGPYGSTVGCAKPATSGGVSASYPVRFFCGVFTRWANPGFSRFRQYDSILGLAKPKRDRSLKGRLWLCGISCIFTGRANPRR